MKTSNAPFNKLSQTSGSNKVEESRILLPRWSVGFYFGDDMNELTKIYDQKLHFPNQTTEVVHVVETEGLVYTPFELFLKNLGEVVVDRVFVIVLASVSFLAGVLVGSWLF